ncbi:Uncharacterised protein [Actinobaculum suis]|uniref:Uncharacterized protein n=1 Tax=Actinobaculum suis TaxID=1657 RepID=A0A7Z8YA29_9ACTO|nr:Uncharacterised protein [Actinobaculum suis]
MNRRSPSTNPDFLWVCPLPGLTWRNVRCGLGPGASVIRHDLASAVMTNRYFLEVLPSRRTTLPERPTHMPAPKMLISSLFLRLFGVPEF